jgi:hypothetical protein
MPVKVVPSEAGGDSAELCARRRQRHLRQQELAHLRLALRERSSDGLT